MKKRSMLNQQTNQLKLMNYHKYIKKAIESGVREARIIDIEKVVTGNWVRMKCQYGCGCYGTRLTCPPYSPTPEYTQKMLEEYSNGLLIVYKVEPEEEENMTNVIRETVANLERKMFLDGHYKAYGMGAGPCEICEKCDVSKPCKYPHKARPSMEASGIDVYQTVRNAGLKLEVVKSHDMSCTFCGLILIE